MLFDPGDICCQYHMDHYPFPNRIGRLSQSSTIPHENADKYTNAWLEPHVGGGTSTPYKMQMVQKSATDLSYLWLQYSTQ